MKKLILLSFLIITSIQAQKQCNSDSDCKEFGSSAICSGFANPRCAIPCDCPGGQRGCPDTNLEWAESRQIGTIPTGFETIDYCIYKK